MDKQIEAIRAIVKEFDLPSQGIKAHYLNLGIDRFLTELETTPYRAMRANYKDRIYGALLVLKHSTSIRLDYRLVQMSVNFYSAADRALADGTVKLDEDVFSMIRMKYPDEHLRGFEWDVDPSGLITSVLRFKEEDSGATHARIVVDYNWFNTESNYTVHIPNTHRQRHKFATLGEAKHFVVGEFRRKYHNCLVADTHHHLRPDHQRGFLSRSVLSLKQLLGRL